MVHVRYDVLAYLEDPTTPYPGPDFARLVLEYPDEDRYRFGSISLPLLLAPEAGRYPGAYYEAAVTFTQEPPEEETDVGSESATIVTQIESVNETWFRATAPPFEAISRDEHLDFDGCQDELPGWLLTEEVSGHVVMELTYDEGLTIETTHLEAGDIETRRQRYDWDLDD